MTANEINRRIQDLRNDYTNGSKIIAYKGLEILTAAYHFSNSKQELLKVADRIIAAKPSMSALKNIVKYTIEHYTLETPADQINQEVRYVFGKAVQETLRNAASSIRNTFYGQTQFITCTFSSTILEFIRLIHSAGLTGKVLILRSVWSGRDYSEQLATELGKSNINCEITEAEFIHSVIDDINFAIIGADAVFPDGSVLNGVPSRLLADSCMGRIPFYVLAESFKKTSEPLAEEGFEIVPAEIISTIFSDDYF